MFGPGVSTRPSEIKAKANREEAWGIVGLAGRADAGFLTCAAPRCHVEDGMDDGRKFQCSASATTVSSLAPALRGERVGVRGSLREFSLWREPLTRIALRAIRPLPARAGEVKKHRAPNAPRPNWPPLARRPA